MTHHRWGEKLAVSAQKSERECSSCGVVKVGRHEFEGGREIHWTEFWRGLDRIEGDKTPPCTGAPRAVQYDARNYPL
jgi:hypothetical protein